MKRQRGFTLLELLIGLVLLGMLLTLLFSGLRLGSRSWDSGEQHTDDSAQLRAVHGFLRRELGQAFPLRWKNEMDTRLAFAGATDALKFIAPLPSQVDAGGLYLLGLELEHTQDGQRLIMKRALTDIGTKDFSPLDQGESSVLAEQVESMDIAYFGAETAESAPDWRETWDDPERLPMLVRIKVRQTGGRDWPDLVARLHLEGG